MNPKYVRPISDCIAEIPTDYRACMQVPVHVYATGALLGSMEDGVFEQAANVACLPGIVGHSFCMPDGHVGYGFPIGGAAAFDADTGVISPGGIGFDINCGMRLVATSLNYEELEPRMPQLMDALFERVPAGLGETGLPGLTPEGFRDLIERGMEWAYEHGYATEQDLRRTEENGRMRGADAGTVSERAVERGHRQVGTLGSGNHYLEIQVVDPGSVFDEQAASKLGIDGPGQVVLMLHTGSRGFGHQVATDYLQSFSRVMKPKYGIEVPDKQLACAPFRSADGQAYFAAMQCAVNMAFVNRQLILHRIREVFSDVLHGTPQDLGLQQIYDVTHNTAKLERHTVDGKERELLVHRKGATRAFAPGMPGLPPEFAELGQPVIIGGSMETGSYLLLGVESGAATFYTTAHGSGRLMGRRAAKRRFHGADIKARMRGAGIHVRAKSKSGLAEEAGAAYKDIDAVVEAAERAGLSRRVVRLRPVGSIKG
ncbi:MAG: RtcB family protein [Spirochaetaceae bacterium]